MKHMKIEARIYSEKLSSAMDLHLKPLLFRCMYELRGRLFLINMDNISCCNISCSCIYVS